LVKFFTISNVKYVVYVHIRYLLIRGNNIGEKGATV